MFTSSEVFSSTSEASSIWQLSQKSHQTLIANNDELEESRRGRAVVMIAAPALESIMEDIHHTIIMYPTTAYDLYANSYCFVPHYVDLQHQCC